MEKEERTPYASDGYIVDQARLTGIRYGAFTSDVNGCGWIAAYNFLRRHGMSVTQQGTADELIRHTLLRGLFGTDLFRLKRMLRRHGYPTDLRFAGKKRAGLTDTAVAGVIYYCHKNGFHFVTFARDEQSASADGETGTRFRFFNAIAGRERHIDTMEGFLQKHNVLPFAILLLWPKAGKGQSSASR
jgi:hypothetical protein